jgi:uncharacterized protein (TIGR03067 family)
MRLLTAVASLLVLSAGPAFAADKPADALAGLQGSWTCLEMIRKGNKPEGRLLLKIEKNRYEMDVRRIGITGIPGGEHSGTIKIEPTRMPAHLDLVGAKYTIPCIYRLRDGKLELLFDPNIKKRPTSFEKPEAGSAYYLFRILPDPANARRHVGPVHLITFSADGKLLLALSIGPYKEKPVTASAKLFQVAGAKEWPHLKIEKKVLAACLSPDGKRLAAVTVDQVLHVWDVASGKEVLSAGYIWAYGAPKPRKEDRLSEQYLGLWPEGLQGLGIAFSPDGKRLAVGHKVTVTIWEPGKKAATAVLKDDDPVPEDPGYQRVLWTPDGKHVVAFGSRNENLRRGRVWDAASGKQVALMPPAWISFLRVTGGGKLLATRAEVERGHSPVQLIDLTTRKQLGQFQPPPERNLTYLSLQAVASADGTRLAVAGGGLIPGQSWDIKKGSMLAKLKGPDDCPNLAEYALEITRDGNVIIGASLDAWKLDGRILFWDAATGKLLTEQKAHGDWIHTLALSPDGTLLASGSEDGTVRLWEVKKLLAGKPK